jgi:hypothetical protein
VAGTNFSNSHKQMDKYTGTVSGHSVLQRTARRHKHRVTMH